MYENLKKRELTATTSKINIFVAIAAIPNLLLFMLPFYLIWQDNLSSELELLKEFVRHPLIIALFIIAGIIIHELIHGITWAIFNPKGFRAIKFGFEFKTITPYCHCKEPMKIKGYLLGAIMPGILMGIIPSIIAIITGDLILLLAGSFFVLAAYGDFYIVKMLRKEDKSQLVLDHPDKIGCYILED